MVTLSIILFVLVAVFIVSTAWTNRVGAPWVPTSFATVHKMMRLADVGPKDTLYDLGCGDGRTLVVAARRYGAKAVGIEIDPLRYVWCQLLITVLGLRKRIKIKYGNFFKHDLSEATVVTCYLLQDTNDRLEHKFKQELASGTRVVSNAFVFSDLPKVRQEDGVQLYLNLKSAD